MVENQRSYDSDSDSQTAPSSFSSTTISNVDGDGSGENEPAARAGDAQAIENPEHRCLDPPTGCKGDPLRNLGADTAAFSDGDDIAMNDQGRESSTMLETNVATAEEDIQLTNENGTTQTSQRGFWRRKRPLPAPSASQEAQQGSTTNTSDPAPPLQAFLPNLSLNEKDIASHNILATTTDNSALIDAHNENDRSEQQTIEEEFQVGDHVYQWCSMLGIPRAFQHHGIVMNVEKRTENPKTVQSAHEDKQTEEDDEVEEEEVILTIADFSNLMPSKEGEPNKSSGSLVSGRESLFPLSTTTSSPPSPSSSAQPNGSSSPIISQHGCLRLYASTSTQQHPWRKVMYDANWFHTHIWKRSGTCTPVSSDPPQVVLQRVNFLLHNTDNTKLLPKYHALYANCESFAVWCKTGSWCTLQATAFLSHAAVGQVKGTATVASLAAAQTVTVPAAGLWGWMGFTSTAPLLSVYPLLVPAIGMYGVVSVGTPLVLCNVAKQEWRKSTDKLNQAFEQYIEGRTRHGEMPMDAGQEPAGILLGESLQTKITT